MPSVSQIVNMRQRRRGPGRRLGRTAGLGCSTLLSLLAALGTVVLALAYAQLSRGLPSLEALPGLLEPPDGLLLQPTRLYDRSGEVVLLTLQNPAAAGRQYLRIPGPAASVLDGAQTGQPAGAQVRSTPTPEGLFLPGALISSTLAIAGPGARQPASLLDLWPGFRPTLAQRLVSNLLFESEAPGLGRDLRVRLVASQVITRFGPAKVIEWYLNSASFGHLAYGADAAARVYFGKPAVQLSLAEAALLAGVASDPGSNPLDAPQAALERRKQVIQAMLDQRLIQPGQAEQAQGEALHLRDTSKQPTGGPGSQPVEVQSAAFTSLVLEQIASQAGQTGLTLSRLERGGFRIITTLNADLQAQSTCAAQAQLARLQAAPEAGQPAAGCPAAGLLPAVSAEAGSSPAASGQALASNVIVLDPRTGQLLALVGGPTPDLNPARLPGHSPGTLLTPFIYLTAFTHGSSPATLLWDIPGDPPMKQAQNFDGQYHGPMRLRTALANDYLAPALQVLSQVGPENAWRTAQQLGMVSLEASAREDAYRLPADGGEVTLLEASQAFGIFSNQGNLSGRPLGPGLGPLQATAILQVEDAYGQKTWLDWSTAQSQPMISPQLAYLLTNVLSDEAARWPSLGRPNSLEIGRPTAAKLGQTASGKDAWTIGYTPQMVVGVWVGYPKPGQGELATSAKISPNAAAALWHAIIQYAHRDLPPLDWTPPSGIIKVEVCDPSGMLPTPECPTRVKEDFLAGSEPTQNDNLYRKVQINRETGRLATLFTPPELVEEHVYLFPPAEAAGWARQAGLDIPPDSYDVVAYAGAAPPFASSSNTQIDSPLMFAAVRDQVQIKGSALGQDFAYYRLQVGRGLNPQAWTQVGQDVTQPVSGGILGTWDVSKLDGLYAIQLLVVDKNQRVDTVNVQVTVDNQPPETSILYPVEGQVLDSAQLDTLTLQASASDNLSMNRIQFFMDGTPLTDIAQPPYAYPWPKQKGKHTFRVVATDQAGNTNETSVAFEVK